LNNKKTLGKGYRILRKRQERHLRKLASLEFPYSPEKRPNRPYAMSRKYDLFSNSS
jgi:hypothetical protein